jgi:hypothetical protein
VITVYVFYVHITYYTMLISTPVHQAYVRWTIPVSTALVRSSWRVHSTSGVFATEALYCTEDHRSTPHCELACVDTPPCHTALYRSLLALPFESFI